MNFHFNRSERQPVGKVNNKRVPHTPCLHVTITKSSHKNAEKNYTLRFSFRGNAKKAVEEFEYAQVSIDDSSIKFSHASKREGWKVCNKDKGCSPFIVISITSEEANELKPLVGLHPMFCNGDESDFLFKINKCEA